MDLNSQHMQNVEFSNDFQLLETGNGQMFETNSSYSKQRASEIQASEHPEIQQELSPEPSNPISQFVYDNAENLEPAQDAVRRDFGYQEEFKTPSNENANLGDLYDGDEQHASAQDRQRNTMFEGRVLKSPMVKTSQDTLSMQGSEFTVQTSKTKSRQLGQSRFEYAGPKSASKYEKLLRSQQQQMKNTSPRRSPRRVSYVAQDQDQKKKISPYKLLMFGGRNAQYKPDYKCVIIPPKSQRKLDALEETSGEENDLNDQSVNLILEASISSPRRQSIDKLYQAQQKQRMMQMVSNSDDHGNTLFPDVKSSNPPESIIEQSEDAVTHSRVKSSEKMTFNEWQSIVSKQGQSIVQSQEEVDEDAHQQREVGSAYQGCNSEVPLEQHQDKPKQQHKRSVIKAYIPQQLRGSNIGSQSSHVQSKSGVTNCTQNQYNQFNSPHLQETPVLEDNTTVNHEIGMQNIETPSRSLHDKSLFNKSSPGTVMKQYSNRKITAEQEAKHLTQQRVSSESQSPKTTQNRNPSYHSAIMTSNSYDSKTDSQVDSMMEIERSPKSRQNTQAMGYTEQHLIQTASPTSISGLHPYIVTSQNQNVQDTFQPEQESNVQSETVQESSQQQVTEGYSTGYFAEDSRLNRHQRRQQHALGIEESEEESSEAMQASIYQEEVIQQQIDQRQKYLNVPPMLQTQPNQHTTETEMILQDPQLIENDTDPSYRKRTQTQYDQFPKIIECNNGLQIDSRNHPEVVENIVFTTQPDDRVVVFKASGIETTQGNLENASPSRPQTFQYEQQHTFHQEQDVQHFESQRLVMEEPLVLDSRPQKVAERQDRYGGFQQQEQSREFQNETDPSIGNDIDIRISKQQPSKKDALKKSTPPVIPAIPQFDQIQPNLVPYKETILETNGEQQSINFEITDEQQTYINNLNQSAQLPERNLNSSFKIPSAQPNQDQPDSEDESIPEEWPDNQGEQPNQEAELNPDSLPLIMGEDAEGVPLDLVRNRAHQDGLAIQNNQDSFEMMAQQLQNHEYPLQIPIESDLIPSEKAWTTKPNEKFQNGKYDLNNKMQMNQKNHKKNQQQYNIGKNLGKNQSPIRNAAGRIHLRAHNAEELYGASGKVYDTDSLSESYPDSARDKVYQWERPSTVDAPIDIRFSKAQQDYKNSLNQGQQEQHPRNSALAKYPFMNVQDDEAAPVPNSSVQKARINLPLKKKIHNKNIENKNKAQQQKQTQISKQEEDLLMYQNGINKKNQEIELKTQYYKQQAELYHLRSKVNDLEEKVQTKQEVIDEIYTKQSSTYNVYTSKNAQSLRKNSIHSLGREGPSRHSAMQVRNPSRHSGRDSYRGDESSVGRGETLNSARGWTQASNTRDSARGSPSNSPSRVFTEEEKMAIIQKQLNMPGIQQQRSKLIKESKRKMASTQNVTSAISSRMNSNIQNPLKYINDSKAQNPKQLNHDLYKQDNKAQQNRKSNVPTSNSKPSDFVAGRQQFNQKAQNNFAPYNPITDLKQQSSPNTRKTPSINPKVSLQPNRPTLRTPQNGVLRSGSPQGRASGRSGGKRSIEPRNTGQKAQGKPVNLYTATGQSSKLRTAAFFGK